MNRWAKAEFTCTVRRICWPREQQNAYSVYVLALPGLCEKLRRNMDCLRDHAAKEAVSQDNLFATVLGMMDVKSAVYQPQLDILSQCRR